jgi:hypothetical protein
LKQGLAHEDSGSLILVPEVKVKMGIKQPERAIRLVAMPFVLRVSWCDLASTRFRNWMQTEASGSGDRQATWELLPQFSQRIGASSEQGDLRVAIRQRGRRREADPRRSARDDEDTIFDLHPSILLF